LLRTSAGLFEVRLPDGTVMVDLQGRFLEYSVARLDPAGLPRLACVNDRLALLLWLARGEPAPAAALEER
jgi:hypothetical protein